MTKPKPPKAPPKPPKKDPLEDFTDAERAELATLQRLPDTEILERSRGLGPGILGRPLAYLAARIRDQNPDGVLGPALLDPDFDKKQLAKRGLRRDADGYIVDLEAADAKDFRGKTVVLDDEAARQAKIAELNAAGKPIDPADLEDPRNPWHYVTLSGAKQLAMKSEVSYKPSVKRKDLIDELQKKGVTPPPVPDALAEDDDDGDDQE